MTGKGCTFDAQQSRCMSLNSKGGEAFVAELKDGRF